MPTAISIMGTISMAIGVFAATNLDDLFVLTGFFADRRMNLRWVVLGQIVGISNRLRLV